jgi:hypothetical protein
MTRKGFPTIENAKQATEKRLKYWKIYLQKPIDDDEKIVVDIINERLKKNKRRF